MHIEYPEEIVIEAAVRRCLQTAAEECIRGDGLNPADCEVSLSVVSEEEIHRLNREFRDTDRVTDVLSFPQYDSPEEIEDGFPTALGDVVICDAVAHRQAEEYGHSYEREFVYLFVHSMLHLLGYDHMEPEEKQEMRQREEEVMELIGLTRDADFSDLSFSDASEEEECTLTSEEYEEYEDLMSFAKEVSAQAYAPYSGFHVGAALLTTDGTVYAGVNVENACYGAGICAERAAVASAVADGCREFEAIALYSPDGAASPCGICRQVLYEFGESIKVIMYDEDGRLDVQELGSLLPKGFKL